MQEKFVKQVRHIIKFPGMYGVYKVEDIHLILFGAMMFSSPKTSQALREFENGFLPFVNKHFGFRKDATWHRLIKFYCGDNGFYEVKIFGELFERYILTLGK